MRVVLALALLTTCVGTPVGRPAEVKLLTATPVDESAKGGGEKSSSRPSISESVSAGTSYLLNKVRKGASSMQAGEGSSSDVPTSKGDLGSLRLKPRVISFNVMVAGLSGLGRGRNRELR